jgi:hypothetical protein
LSDQDFSAALREGLDQINCLSSSHEANKGIAMKSVLPSTKFKLHAPERQRKNRLQTPLNGNSPPPLSGSAILKDPPSGSHVAKLLGHLDQLSQPRVRLYRSPISASSHYRLPEIPRYIFVGDQPGESEIRLGIFAGLRGEDNVGAKAIVEFIDDLVAMPSLGSAFRIYAYPTANPLSYTTGAPRKQTDRSVTNETGRKVKFPEALIEREIFVVQFHGLVVIHTTDEPEGLQAAVYGANLREATSKKAWAWMALTGRRPAEIFFSASFSLPRKKLP